MQISVCMYHGSPEDRAELRRTVLASPRKHESLPTKKPAPKKKWRLSRRDRDPGSDEESVIVVEDELNAPDDDDPNPTTQLSQFPVVITTYEMIIKDRVHLARYDWGQVIVDEGHRLKNMDSILMREIKKYPSAGRTLLTGTPLHVSMIQRSRYMCKSHRFRRTTWQSSGLSSISSCQKSSTMFPPSKNRRPFYHLLSISHQSRCSQVQDSNPLQRPRGIAQLSTNSQVARDSPTISPPATQSRRRAFASSQKGVCAIRAVEPASARSVRCGC